MAVPADPPLIIGNLDAELSWARARLGTHAQLPAPVRTALAAAGAAMAVYAHNSPLWLPAAFDRSRFGPLLAGTGAEPFTGALPAVQGALSWAQTDETSATGALAAELNDRRTSLALESPLDATLDTPQPALLESMAAFLEAMASWPHPHPWILKSPLSASGRDRVKRSGAPEIDAETRARRLFNRFKVMILEPWLDRIEDYGSTGTISEAGLGQVRSHRLEVSGNGVFRAVVLGAEVPAAVTEEAERIGDVLFARGYRGPFSIDAFRYRTPAGTALRGLCEINARHSFGHIAWAAVERFQDQLPAGRYRLDLLRKSTPDPSATVLVGPSSVDSTAVQLSRWG